MQLSVICSQFRVLFLQCTLLLNYNFLQCTIFVEPINSPHNDKERGRGDGGLLSILVAFPRPYSTQPSSPLPFQCQRVTKQKLEAE